MQGYISQKILTIKIYFWLDSSCMSSESLIEDVPKQNYEKEENRDTWRVLHGQL